MLLQHFAVIQSKKGLPGSKISTILIETSLIELGTDISVAWILEGSNPCILNPK